MVEENISEEFRLKNIDETRDYFIEEINQNKFTSKKHKNVCMILNYIEHLLILASVVTGCVSISDFASLVDIPISNESSTVGLQICARTAGVKKYKSISKKKKKNRDKIVLPAKTNVNNIEVTISKMLIDSYISHDDSF